MNSVYIDNWTHTRALFLKQSQHENSGTKRKIISTQSFKMSKRLDKYHNYGL